MKRLLIASALLLASFNASAWALIPGVPQAVTVFAHFVGGYVVAKLADDAGAEPVTGAAIAAGIGLAKELSDLHFSVVDFVAWPLGAWVYHAAKDSPRCWETEPPEHAWYVTGYKVCVPKVPT